MAQKKWVLGVTAGLLIVLLLGGYLAIAADLGSKDDPLVTLGYITDELTPQIEKKVDEVIAAKTRDWQSDLNTQYQTLSTELDSKVAGILNGSNINLNDPTFVQAVADIVVAQLSEQGGVPSEGGATYTKVEVPAGQTLKLKIGSELVLRLQDATCAADANPGLINLTDGGSINGGDSVKKNNLYLCTIDGHGIKAGGEKVTVFVRGGYTIA